MKQIKDLMANFNEKEREEVEKTIDNCMARICCENVDWRNFNVNDSAIEAITGMLSKLEISFLMTIADRANQEQERIVTIFCSTTKEKMDSIWFIKVSVTELHASMYLSPKTRAYLNKTE